MRKHNPKFCYVITCPKCGSGDILMQNHYKDPQGFNKWNAMDFGPEEADGALDLHKKYLKAIDGIRFRCTACGYATQGFMYMNYSSDFWSNCR